MREIKFRAWNNRTEKMYPVKSICENGALEGNLNDSDDEHGVWIPECQMTLMQFTGLKDKNGKEIYEGDVLHMADADWEVRWNDQEARFEIIFPPNGTTYAIYALPIGEIIGNIYENPELLK